MHTIHELQQGSPEWLAHRDNCHNASDAPAMLGISKYVTRNELIAQAATGITREVDANTQRLFDDGHATEALARPIAEEIIGEDLYPITASLAVDGLQKRVSASYDGATMDEKQTFEHKRLNAELAASLDAGVIPDMYHPQLEQQLLIIGAERCLFMASDGTREAAKHAWYTSNPALRARLIAGWKQFELDVAAYKPVEVIPAAVAAPVMSLPAVSVKMEGAIAVISNLDLFGQKLTEFVGKLNMKPEDDQGFADAENAVKILQNAQEALEQAEAAALAQMSNVDELRRTVAMYVKTARDTRLVLEKAVKSQKETVRANIIQTGCAAFTAHIAALNTRLGKPYMPVVPVDFTGAIKGKRTITSLRDAIDTELARGKIAANEIADNIQLNLTTLRELAKDHAHLFADAAQIVLKAPDDLTTLVKLRIAEFEAAEAKKRDVERERIRVEEEAKAQAKVKAEEAARVAAEAKAKADAEAAERAAAAKAEADLREKEALTRTPPTAALVQAAPVAQPLQDAAFKDIQSVHEMERTPKGRTLSRPTDADIIEVLSLHYRVHESKIVEWLMGVDWKAANLVLSQEFAA